MSLQELNEVPVWSSEGYEGRFLKWEDGQWQAFEHRNYRHWFSPPQALTSEDIRALRTTYRISLESLPDILLVRTAPTVLVELANRDRHDIS
jgi:hypothetical protein